MTRFDDQKPGASRRSLLTGAVGLIGAAGVAVDAKSAARAPAPKGQVEPFWGRNQAGIVTPAQTHCYFAAFDLTAAKRDDVIALLRTWTDAAASLTAGLPLAAATSDPSDPPADSGEVLGL